MKNYNALLLCVGVMALMCVQDVSIAAADYAKLLGSSANNNMANDTTIANLSGYQGKNWGAHTTTAYFGASNGTFLSDILLKFDFLNLTAANITSANLSLFSTGEIGACSGEGKYSLIADIYPLKTSWKEGYGVGDTGSTGTASWQNSTDGVPWASGIFSDNDTLDKIGTSVIECGIYTRFYWELNATVIKKMASGEIPNYGFVVRAGNFTNNPIYFYMREISNSTLVPWLELGYSSLPPAPPAPPASVTDVYYCSDFSTLYARHAFNLTVNGISNYTVTETSTNCVYGCSNATLWGGGLPGCKEATYIQWIEIIVLVILVSIFATWCFK